MERFLVQHQSRVSVCCRVLIGFFSEGRFPRLAIANTVDPQSGHPPSPDAGGLMRIHGLIAKVPSTRYYRVTPTKANT
jgi:hypothetical protein